MSEYVNKKFEVVGDLILSGNPIETYFEPADSPVPIREIVTNSITLTGARVEIPAYNQTLSLSSTFLTISDGNTLDLAGIIPEVEKQTLSLSGDNLYISSGNDVDLSTYKQSLTLSGNQLTISDNNTVDLSHLAEDLDNQTLSLSGNNLHISNGNDVDLSYLQQTLSLSGNTLTISNGNLIDLSVIQSQQLAPVFITNIDNKNGLIEKRYVQNTTPANYIIDSITVDDDSNLDITIEWDGPVDEWVGTAYINDTLVPVNSVSRIGNTRRFTATLNVDLAGEEHLHVTANGSEHSIPVTLLGGGPGVTDVQFSSLPTHGGTQQTTFLDGDSVTLFITFDTEDVTTISLDGGNDTATSSQTDRTVDAVSNGDGTSTVTYTTTIDTTLSTITQVPVKVSAKNSFGTQGDVHTSTTTIPVRTGPEITNITFGSYPGTQTELKDNDTISITVEFDTNNVSRVQLQSGSSYASASQTKTVNVSSLSGTATITIDTSVTTAQEQPVRIRAIGGNNNYGNYTNSTDKLTVNNVGPTYSGFNVSYPTNQTALKQTETADVLLTINNTGSNPTYTYSTPSNQITIPDSSTYNNTKTVTCTNPGVYNIASNNYSVAVNRAENNKTTSYSGVIKIADVLPTITVTSPSSMKSGGEENTTVQIYQITVTSNQQLKSFDLTTTASAGTLTGSWNGSNNNRTWNRNLQVSDLDLKGVHDWINLAAVNLSNMSQDSITSGATYKIAGFVSRSLTMSALSRTRALGTTVQDPTRLSISETFRGSIQFDDTISDGTTLNADISTGVDVTSKYTIVNSQAPDVVDYNGDTFFYLDRVAVNNNVSGTSVITVQET